MKHDAHCVEYAIWLATRLGILGFHGRMVHELTWLEMRKLADAIERDVLARRALH